MSTIKHTTQVQTLKQTIKRKNATENKWKGTESILTSAIQQQLAISSSFKNLQTVLMVTSLCFLFNCDLLWHMLKVQDYFRQHSAVKNLNGEEIFKNNDIVTDQNNWINRNDNTGVT